jgi:hypothetical protein
MNRVKNYFLCQYVIVDFEKPHFLMISQSKLRRK